MSKCQRCESERIVRVNGKCCDACFVEFDGKEYVGYAPNIPNVCAGDNVFPGVCLECGQVQGEFPVADPDLETM